MPIPESVCHTFLIANTHALVQHSVVDAANIILRLKLVYYMDLLLPHTHLGIRHYLQITNSLADKNMQHTSALSFITRTAKLSFAQTNFQSTMLAYYLETTACPLCISSTVLLCH